MRISEYQDFPCNSALPQLYPFKNSGNAKGIYTQGIEFSGNQNSAMSVGICLDRRH